MVEAQACGTPVVAFRHGAVPEVIAEGETGFVCDTVEEAVAAVARLGEISRRTCRSAFEERFTAERMAREYLAVYQGQFQESAMNRRPRE
jgi:glycosyltransferase involved in cell wall biosynthesis